MNKSKVIGIGFTAFLATASLSEACTMKPGMLGGQFKLPPLAKPVCGAERAKIIEGLKASYQKQGKQMPKYSWLEGFVISDDDDAKVNATLKIGNTMFDQGYVPDALTSKSGEKFGYYSTLYKNRKTGRLIQKFLFTEPRGTIMWKKAYVVLMGY